MHVLRFAVKDFVHLYFVRLMFDQHVLRSWQYVSGSSLFNFYSHLAGLFYSIDGHL